MRDLAKPLEPLKIEAVVKFNDGEAIVLNRKPDFLYERRGDYLVAFDGPFYNVYGYSHRDDRQAFGGRMFTLPMVDGPVTVCSGQWWDSGAGVIARQEGFEPTSVTHQTIEGLLDCYVYCGCSAVKKEFDELRAEYTGVVYPYYDYKAIISYKPQLLKRFRKQEGEKQAKKHLVKKVKALHVESLKQKAEIERLERYRLENGHMRSRVETIRKWCESKDTVTTAPLLEFLNAPIKVERS